MSQTHPLADRAVRLRYLADWRVQTPARIRQARHRQSLYLAGIVGAAAVLGLALAVGLAQIFADVSPAVWLAFR